MLCTIIVLSHIIGTAYHTLAKIE